MPAATVTVTKAPLWLIRRHHFMRTAFCLVLLVATGLLMDERSASSTTWIATTLILLVYPHLLYFRARLSEHQIRTELRSLTFDSVALGMFVSAFGFPLWITFSAVQCTIVNNAINKGWRSVPSVIIGLLAGGGVGNALFGVAPAPEVGWPVATTCMIGITLYVLAIGDTGFVSNRKLRSTRQTLQEREKELLAANQAMAAQLHEIDLLQSKLQDQANRDPLTGLFNRRYLEAVFPKELAACAKKSQPVALLMIDIDHFKSINDRYGHPAGDEVLGRIGASLSGMARSEDIACRYGGEEFLVLLPTMPLAVATQRAEMLRKRFADQTVIAMGTPLKLTLSIGVAVFPEHGDTPSALIACADDALYSAKRRGRNRVEVAGANPHPYLMDDSRIK